MMREFQRDDINKVADIWLDTNIKAHNFILIWITVIMILLSLGIAFLISRQISKSLIRINESAKALAKGDFDVRFEGKDYREVAEPVSYTHHINEMNEKVATIAATSEEISSQTSCVQSMACLSLIHISLQTVQSVNHI